MQDNRVDVILVGGAGRSGSTLLDRILGQLNETISTGELGFIWANGYKNNELCGCGKKFHNCGFWRKTLRNAFSDSTEQVGPRAYRLRELIGKRRVQSFKLAYPRLRTDKFESALSEYTTIIEDLYSSIVKVSGKKIIIDSCGYPTNGLVLKEADKIRLHLIHLVRDGRATVYSWMRKKKNHGVTDSDAYLSQLSPSYSSIIWNFDNMIYEMLCNEIDSSVLVRYEDMALNPTNTVEKISGTLDIPLSNNDAGDIFYENNKINLRRSHTVGGNKTRFKEGEVTIQLDDSWRDKMDKITKYYVSCLEIPFLYHYGYIG